MTQAATAPAPRRMSRDDIVRLGQVGKPWEFVPIGFQAVRIAPGDAGLRVLLAANLAKLGLRTAALEQLEAIDGEAAEDLSVQGLRRAVQGLPDDRLDLEALEAVCRANLDALAARGTDLRGELSRWRGVAGEWEWFRALDGNIVRRAGDSWLGLSDQRSAAAGFVAQHLPPGAKRANHYTLEGIDPPWLLQRVAEAAGREKEGFWPRLVIVQADAMEFLDGLAQADLRDVLSEERTSVLVGPDAGQRLLTDLRRRIAGQIVGAFIPQRSLRTKVTPGVSEVLSLVEQEQVQAHQRLHAQVTEMYRGRDTAWWARRHASAGQRGGGGPLRVLVPTCRYTTYVQHAGRDLVEVLRRCGCRAELLIEDDDSFRFSTLSYLRAIARLKPDLIVMVNYTRANIGEWLPPEVPFVCWIQDSMPHQFRAEIGAAQTERDFLVGHLHDELFTQFGFPRERTLRIPVVASGSKFHDGPVAPELAERFACEIALVTHHSETPAAMHARLLAETGPDPQTRAVLDALRPEAASIASAPESCWAMAALRDATAAAIRRVIGREPKPEGVTAIYRQYTLPMADRVLRHQTVEWAAEIAERRGWRFHLYGRGWEAHPRFGRFARGGVAHGEELRACYQSAGIHVHASISAMVHQRVLECALSGGLPRCRLLRDALGPGNSRLCELLRAEVPRRRFTQGNGYLGLPVGEHPAAMAQAAFWQKLGIEHPEMVWVPEEPPAGGARAQSVTVPEYDPAWLLGDLSQAAFSTAAGLEAVMERAAQEPGWRRAAPASIAGRARERLTHESFVKRTLGMIYTSMDVAEPRHWDGLEESVSPARDETWMAGALAGHRQLRARLDRPADEAAIRRLMSRYRPPEWVSGAISPGDAAFLYDVARAIDPERIIEVGTASGVSTAVLLMALADMGRGLRDEARIPRLYSYDTAGWCYFDESRPVASAVGEMAPELEEGLIVRRAGAPQAAAEFADRPVSLAFLDANHAHPFPIADLLALQPALRPGAWVVLHDIQLPRMAREHEEQTGTKLDGDQAGVERLMTHWRGEKIAGEGAAFNIGAIRMPMSGRLVAAEFRELIDLPWETAVPHEYMRILGRA